MLNRTVVWSALACVGFVLPMAACGGSNSSAAPRRGPGGEGGAVPVVTAKVTQKNVPVDIAAIGNVEAYSTITVQSQVTGTLMEVKFNEGDYVKKGQPLFVIDPRPFVAALAQAEANMARSKALLAQAGAALNRDAAQADYSQLQAERNAELNRQGIISKDVAQQMQAGADAAKATVAADKAAVESAKAELVAQEAAVATARLSLAYTNIASPLDGRSGNLAAKAGNLVTANGTQLTTIQQVQPTYVTFSVPATHLPTIKQHLTSDPLAVVATPQDAQGQPATGKLTFLDNSVDSSTDTIRLKATFTNDDRRLWPGQFVRVSLRLTTLPNAIVVPSEAVQTGQDGQYVFVVGKDSKVEQRPIVVGERAQSDTVIRKGLQPGETIVTEGQLRLEQGTRIQTREGGPAGAPGGGRGQGAPGAGGERRQRGQGGQGGGTGQGAGPGQGTGQAPAPPQGQPRGQGDQPPAQGEGRRGRPTT